MNPLTQIKNTQKASKYEIAQGFGDSASWHARFKHSAYIFAGGLSYDLTEGDLLAIFAQYGELVDINLVKDKDTGKTRGFAFAAYEDQRSTVLAVDNLSGARVAGRTIRVEHVDNYKRKKAEMEGREPSPDTEEDADDEAVPDDADAGAPLAARAPAGDGGGGGPGGQDAWMGSNSLFSLLQDDALPLPPPPRPGSTAAAAAGPLAAGDGKKAKKAKKEKKEKKLKKEKKAKDKGRSPSAQQDAQRLAPHRADHGAAADAAGRAGGDVPLSSSPHAHDGEPSSRPSPPRRREGTGGAAAHGSRDRHDQGRHDRDRDVRDRRDRERGNGGKCRQRSRSPADRHRSRSRRDDRRRR